MSIKSTIKHLLMVALGFLASIGLQASDALAQATDLVCSGCVQGTDIQNGTIGPNKLIPGSINATTIANQSIGPNKLIPGSINQTTIATDAIRSNKILNGSVQNVDLANGAVTFAKLNSNLQMRIEDLEDDLDALLNPGNCTNQTLNGAWQAYAIHSDENSIQAGWERCAFSVNNNAVTSGTCTNQLGDTFSITSGSFTVSSACIVTGGLVFSGIFGSAAIAHATLDQSRNMMAGVGAATDVGPLAITVLRR